MQLCDSFSDNTFNLQSDHTVHGSNNQRFPPEKYEGRNNQSETAKTNNCKILRLNNKWKIKKVVTK